MRTPEEESGGVEARSEDSEDEESGENARITSANG